MKKNNRDEREKRIDRAIMLIALIIFFTSTLLMFKEDYAFKNPLDEDARKMGNIVQGTGDIRWKRFDRIQWEAAENDGSLFMKDQIFVGKNSNLEIVLDGVKVKLQQNTLITIRKVKGTLDLQIMYGQVTVDKPPADKKIVMRNEKNQTVWENDGAHSAKVIDVTPQESMVAKNDNIEELKKTYWVAARPSVDPQIETMPEPPEPYIPPPPPAVHGLKMAQIEQAPYREIEKIEQRKELLAQNMTAKPETVTSIDRVTQPLRKIFAKWTINAFGLVRNAITDNQFATATSTETWGPGLQIEYRRFFDSWSLGFPFLWAPSVAKVGTSQQVIHMARGGMDAEFNGPYVNYITGARLNYENYVSVNQGLTPYVNSRLAVPLMLGVSKQFVSGVFKHRGTLSWCPTYSITAGTTNFICMNSTLSSYWMSRHGFNLGSSLYVNYYDLDLKTDKFKAVELGVGVGAEF